MEPTTWAEFTVGIKKSWVGHEGLGIVMSPHDQGDTDMCWGFSTNDAISTVDCVYGGGICTQLSVQELMNHVHQKFPPKKKFDIPPTGVETSSYYALKYAKRFGVPSKNAYPFVGHVQHIAFNDRPHGPGVDRVYVRNFTESVNERRTEVMRAKIMKMIDHGPVIAVVLLCDSFQKLKGEIYKGPNQKEKKHARDKPKEAQYHSVLLVGYGFEGEGDKKTEYCLCKNTYADRWGFGGYGKLAFSSMSEFYAPIETYHGN